jgi:hypothetical protein
MVSTACLKGCSPNSETKSLSSIGWLAVESGMGGTACSSDWLSVSRCSRVRDRMPGSFGSTRRMSCMRPRRLSNTTTSSDTISTMSGVPKVSGGAFPARRFST